jgi:hypothetical protein
VRLVVAPLLEPLFGERGSGKRQDRARGDPGDADGPDDVPPDKASTGPGDEHAEEDEERRSDGDQLVRDVDKRLERPGQRADGKRCDRRAVVVA